jgi:hypothetical protein
MASSHSAKTNGKDGGNATGSINAILKVDRRDSYRAYPHTPTVQPCARYNWNLLDKIVDHDHMVKPFFQIWAIFTKPSQLCDRANLLYGPIHPIVHWLLNKRFAWPQSCEGFVNMARCRARFLLLNWR